MPLALQGLYLQLGVAVVRANQILRDLDPDGYVTHLPLKRALAANGFLAYESEGKPLPILHGFPVRAVFPGVAGGTWVKWLVEIAVD